MTTSVVSNKALEAIQAGIKRGDTIYELEYLGVESRTLNLLADSQFQILKLEDLVKCSRNKLLCVENFGPKYLNDVLAALAAYHLLGRRRKKIERLNAIGIRQGIRTMPPEHASNARSFHSVLQRGLKPPKILRYIREEVPYETTHSPR